MKRILIAMIILAACAGRADAYCMSATMTQFTEYTVVHAAPHNHNFNAIGHYLEGYFDPACSFTSGAAADWYFLTGGGDANSLHTHQFADITGGTFSAAQHGDLSAATSTMHSATSSKFIDTGHYNATNTAAALTEIATFVGYSANGGATGSVMVFLGTSFNSAVASNTSVTTPVMSASSSLMIVIGANLNNNGVVNGGCFVTPKIDGEPIEEGATDARYRISDGAVGYIDHEKMIYLANGFTSAYYTGPLDLTVTHTISMHQYAGVGGCVSADNFQLTVFKLGR